MTVHAPPSMGLDNRKFGFWAFLANEVLFFTVLIANYLALSKEDPIGTFDIHGEVLHNGQDMLNIPLTAFNTFVLLTSSFTVVLALQFIQQDKQFLFRLSLIITFIFGSFFVAVQGVEYYLLIVEDGLGFDTLFGGSFFTLTGFHGLHVIGGLVWLGIIFFKAFGAMGGYSSKDNMGIEVFGLYWHFVDIVWLLLFSLVYLI